MTKGGTMNWLSKFWSPKFGRSKSGDGSTNEGLWSQCPACEATLYAVDLRNNAQVCPKCGYHGCLGARACIDLLLDAENRCEIGSGVTADDSLRFRDSRRYTERLADASKKTGESDSLLIMQGVLKAVPVVVAVVEADFLDGSMGSAFGERFVRGVRTAVVQKSPFICVFASSGLRLQEGVFSLMQMAKTSAALALLSNAGVPFISVLTDPTARSACASLAAISDIVIAESGARVDLTDPPVTDETNDHQELPENPSPPGFSLEAGAIDMIVDRREIKDRLASLLSMLQKQPVAA